MPESVLWSLDARGRLLKLSTHSTQWRWHCSPRSKVGHFSRASAASWCVWAIASDQQCYLMVLSSDLKIRVREALYENERATIFNTYSGKRLVQGDPPNFCRVSDGRELRKENVRLPSSRWSWEDVWYVQETNNGELTEKGGWQYANDFSGPFVTEKKMLMVVRRRKWIRFRRFTATDRWLYIHSPHADHTTDPFVNIVVGGEMLPHRPDGALLIYGITMEGVVYFRYGVERACPEGVEWQLVELPGNQGVINCSVGPMGSLWLMMDDGTILVRKGVTWQNVYGTSWSRLHPPPSLLPHQMVVQAIIGVRSAWAVANTGHFWFRKGIDVFLAEDLHLSEEKRELYLLGAMWVEMTGRVLMLTIAPNDQVWGLDLVSRELLYRTGISPNSPSGKVWRKLVLNLEKEKKRRRRGSTAKTDGKLNSSGEGYDSYELERPFNFQIQRKRRNSLPPIPIRGRSLSVEEAGEQYVNIEVGRDSMQIADEVEVEIDADDEGDSEDDSEKVSDTEDASLRREAQTALRWCCATALELPQSDLPHLWKLAARKVADGSDDDDYPETNTDPMKFPWRNLILNRLKASSMLSHCSDFKDFPSVIERGTWVKEALVHLEQRSTGLWLPGRLILEQWRDGSDVNGVLKMQVTPMEGRRPIPDEDLNLSPLLSVRSITCVGKIIEMSGHFLIGIFVDASPSPFPVKLVTEEEVEDWVSTITLVCCEHRSLLLHTPHPARLFVVTRLGEVLMSEEEAEVKPMSQRYWRQMGGYFRLVESGAEGVTWALGHDDRPWIFTGGYGGGFFKGLVSSVAGINQLMDTRKVYTFEYQRWRFLSGYTDRSSWLGPHMWSDETGKEERRKESFKLLSHSWKWVTDWFVDHSVSHGCDADGWQYANTFAGPYERANRWNTAFRRRKWVRTLQVETSGPWKEALGLRLKDISIQPAPIERGVVHVWAIARNGEVLRRLGVRRCCPEGTSWEHIEAENGFQSISISPCLHVWVIDLHGTAWIRMGVSRENLRGLSWLLVGITPDNVPFRQVSAGGMFRLYALDVQDRLWRRIGASLTNAEGVQWVLVSLGVASVSCGPDGSMLAVMRKSGSIAERKGIAVDAPGGRCWSPVLKGLCENVTVRGSSCL